MHKQKRANKTKISKQKALKATVFWVHSFKRVKVACLRFALFVRVKSFRKK